MDLATARHSAWRQPIRLDRTPPAGADNALPLRHVASLMVIFGHSYALTVPRAGSVDPINVLMPGFSAGSLGVYIFFAISGYLVMLSALRQPGVVLYLRNRALRIFPAYLVALGLCVVPLGLLFSSLSPADYLQHPDTWAHLRDNLLPISFNWYLPGVFADNPYTGVVNGSLWSLGLELRWYGYVGALLALGIAGRRWAFTPLALAFLTLAAWEWSVGKPDPLHYRALSAVFVSSALIAHWRHRVWISGWLLLALLAAAGVASGSRWFGPIAVAAALYGCFWLIYAVPPLRWPRGRDYSYGLFLYGFPVQQALVASLPQIAPMALFAAATAISLLLAAASWRWVEAPALRLKGARASVRPDALPVSVGA
jgi:peptidoglycan/LPS O-acetylase OafA/YrhL